MRKRRVLALWLALSLVLSGNGMTVLAAETGMEQPVVTTQTETPETGENTGESATPGTTEGSETPETVQEPGESETPGEVQEPGENETPEEAEKPEEAEEPGESETPEEAEQPEETEDPDAPKEDESADPAEEQPVEDEETAPVEEPEGDEIAVQTYVSRIVTFTDDTGMQVTYDANASTQYDYVVENGVLTAVRKKTTDSEGNAGFEPVSFTGNVVLTQPEEGDPYTSVAADVFRGNQSITYVKLPAGVNTVTAEAFKGCTALKGVYLPASVNNIENSAFENCTALTQISVPKAVTVIGDSAFKGDARLHLIHIKDRDYCNLTTIGESAFEGCATLAEFCSDTAFVVPEKLQSIGKSAFKGCRCITKIDFSGTALSSLGTNAFEGCTELKDLNMGDNISVISQYAFAGCSGLMSVIIQDGNSLTIDSYAFKDCFSLRQLVLPQSVSTVQDNAFQGCSNLGRVEVHNFTMDFGANDRAFPLAKLASGAKRLFIINRQKNGKMSSGEIYARNHSDVVEWEYFDGGKDQLYDCVIEGEDPVKKDGVITGGKIWVETTDGKKFRELNGGKGVECGDTKYYIYYTASTDFVLVSGSLRCNGEPVQKDENNKYFFTMPVGGVIISAEFAPKTTDKIAGKAVTVEYSNGEPMYVENSNGELTCNGVSLKVGQTTRMFLIDEKGEAIPSSKIQSIESSVTKVATVTKSGVITAVGTNGSEKGEAEITAIVNGEDGTKVPVLQKIIVVDADAASIALKATKYEPQIISIEQSEETGIQTASVSKNNVMKSGLEITIKANVYTAEQENIGKDLTWTTSNSKVAKVRTAKTIGKDPVNVVEIQRNCEGEATITATALNAENKKVTQKFIIQVYQKTYKLATTAVTVNPHVTAGSEIEVIGAYGQDVSDASVELWKEGKDQKSNQPLLYPDGDFKLTALVGGAKNTKTFRIEVNSRDTISNKTYDLKASINGNKETLFPIKITVKRSAPNPTVKFNTYKAKFNLFYKNGGTTAEGDQVSVVSEITKLGDVEVKKAVLEPLSQKEDDRLFTENFVIDEGNTDLAKGKVAIKRSAGAFKYTSNKKAAVTGYLVLYFKGYDDSAAKKVKVTMPTCTTAPSWALRTAKGTYRADVGLQDISFELFDKKSKTKEKVMLDQTYTPIAEGVNEVAIGEVRPYIENGDVKIQFVPGKGSIRLVLKNPAWDYDQNGMERTLTFTYNVAVSDNKPVIKPDQNTVSLNLNYPEKTETFKLVSNLGGVKINKAQTFTPVITNANADQIQNLQVTYEDGVGTVSIESGKTVKKGNYKFECIPNGDTELKKAVLTIKVADVKPGVKFGKGSLQLNGVVYANNKVVNDSNAELSTSVLEDDVEEYREVSERSFKVSGVPEGYQLAPVGSGDDKTSVVGAMPNKPNLEKNFEFAVEEDPAHEQDNVLKVSLKETVAKGTYKFKLTPRYVKTGMKTVSAQTVDFQVKVLSESDIFLNVTARGKVNLVNRGGEANDKNGILYTPALKNIVGEIEAVEIWDAGTLKESKYFDISLIKGGKDAGKFFVTPKKPMLTEKPDGSTEYTYPELENNKQYQVRIWVKVKGYAGKEETNGGVLSKIVKIKSAQVLPKVTLSRTSMDVYLSTKNYNADFVVKPKEGSVGTIEEIYFDEKDELANDSFELIRTPQADGSMKVTVHLKEAVGFANGTVNNVKFYVKYKGQGTNTPEKATGFTMKIRVN